MTRTPVRISVSALFATAALFLPAIIQAQIPGGTSAREIPTEVQKTDTRVDQVIERANDHFRKGTSVTRPVMSLIRQSMRF